MIRIRERKKHLRLLNLLLHFNHLLDLIFDLRILLFDVTEKLMVFRFSFFKLLILVISQECLIEMVLLIHQLLVCQLWLWVCRIQYLDCEILLGINRISKFADPEYNLVVQRRILKITTSNTRPDSLGFATVSDQVIYLAWWRHLSRKVLVSPVADQLGILVSTELRANT